MWSPSYIDHLLKEAQPLNKGCNQSLNDMILSSSSMYVDRFLCDCSRTQYANVTFNLQHIDSWKSLNATMNNSLMIDGNYEWVWLEGVIWENIHVQNVSFNNLVVFNSTWQSVTFTNASFNNSVFCGVQFNQTFVNNQTIEDFLPVIDFSCNSTNNSLVHCTYDANTIDYNKEYLHDFIVYSGAIIGSFVTSVAVYFIIRSFCLG